MNMDSEKAKRQIRVLLFENVILIRHKISPNPSLPKRGILDIPLWKRGKEGDFSIITISASQVAAYDAEG